MPKDTKFVCSQCGNEFSKWQGKCEACGEWNAIVEVKLQTSTPLLKFAKEPGKPEKLSAIAGGNEDRVQTGIKEFDRCLGGGIVTGEVILLAGRPGIGKSTLLLQVCEAVSAVKGGKILYASGEESAAQIKMRASRLGARGDIIFYQNSNILEVLEEAEKFLSFKEAGSDEAGLPAEALAQAGKPTLLIIDSIQSMYSPDFPGSAGGLVQVQAVGSLLVNFAKTNNVAVIATGHVTKEGTAAGPRVLEHMVDAVLYLDGDKYHELRVLRGEKNRFGPTDEVGVFLLEEKGLVEVKNPSGVLLGERISSPGSVVAATVEGTRPFLVEIQALVSKTNFGYPKRTASGFDAGRLSLLLAVLEKRAGVLLSSFDVFLNTVGGFRVGEPAVDLAVCLALASARSGKVVKDGVCVFGEVGLSGEVRSVRFGEKRIKEAEKLGFSKIIVPKEAGNAGGKIQLVRVKTVGEAVKEALS